MGREPPTVGTVQFFSQLNFARKEPRADRHGVLSVKFGSCVAVLRTVRVGPGKTFFILRNERIRPQTADFSSYPGGKQRLTQRGLLI